MTPYEAIREEFDFPFELYPLQIEKVNELAPYDRQGKYWEPGTGKTAGAAHATLHISETQGIDHWICPMPPLLTTQWQRFLNKISRKSTGEALSSLVYEGSPKAREKLDLNVRYILVSYGLMRNDLETLINAFGGRRVGVLIDEGHAIKNVRSATHKAVDKLSQGRPLLILTGTPLTTPMDAYAYVRLIAPKVYRNFRQFEQLHVKEYDEWGGVVAWNNLDLLSSNMRVQTTRLLRRDLKSQAPPVTFTVWNYDLDPAHAKLYKRIADERLVEFESGKEINAISAQALRSALQQVVLNWSDFDEDSGKEPAALALIHETFDELGPDAKLVVVANFIRSNRMLVAKLKQYNAVAVYGEISPAGKREAIRRFIEDAACRCIILQPQSAGFGVDGLQSVCSDMLVLEAPTVAPPFHQVVARLDRDGQANPVHCRVAVANGTVQVRMFNALLSNDATINAVQGGFEDLKQAIHGH